MPDTRLDYASKPKNEGETRPPRWPGMTTISFHRSARALLNSTITSTLIRISSTVPISSILQPLSRSIFKSTSRLPGSKVVMLTGQGAKGRALNITFWSRCEHIQVLKIGKNVLVICSFTAIKENYSVGLCLFRGNIPFFWPTKHKTS